MSSKNKDNKNKNIIKASPEENKEDIKNEIIDEILEDE